MTTTRPRRRTNLRRGSAMVEFVLGLPLLVFVMSIMLFMGWSLPRKQNVIVASRYLVWRGYEGQSPSDVELNRMFLEGRATDIDRQSRRGPMQGLDHWVDATYAADPLAGDLADELIRNRWPHGRRVSLRAEWTARSGLWQNLSGPMHFAHAREGHEWVRGQAAPWQVLQDEYYPDLDDALGSIGGPGAGLARMLQRLYAAHW